MVETSNSILESIKLTDSDPTHVYPDGWRTVREIAAHHGLLDDSSGALRWKRRLNVEDIDHLANAGLIEKKVELVSHNPNSQNLMVSICLYRRPEYHGEE